MELAETSSQLQATLEHADFSVKIIIEMFKQMPEGEKKVSLGSEIKKMLIDIDKIILLGAIYNSK